MCEGELKDGKENGKIVWWHENGKRKFEFEFKEGKPNGIRTEWDAKGKIIKVQEWKEGEKIKDYPVLEK